MDKVFYSWQSDLPNATNRTFIGTALQNAVASLSSTEHLEAIEVDRDTVGLSGSPDIAQAIFEKIEGCLVFVCDVSIINSDQVNGGEQDPPSLRARTTPNPNVLIELGYALKALGPDRVIMICNTSFGSIEQLPFDLRHRRITTYSMPKDQAERASERRKLEEALKTSLNIILQRKKQKVAEDIKSFEPVFSHRSGYKDPLETTFGQNDWTGRLGALNVNLNGPADQVQARSWLSVIIEPIGEASINLGQASSELKHFILPHPEPYGQFTMPGQVKTGTNTVVFYDNTELAGPDAPWTKYIRMDGSGNMEYVSSQYRVVNNYHKRWAFDFVQMIGRSWQFLFLARYLLNSNDYNGFIRLSINLVGTKETMLIGFSTERGEGGRIWPNPVSSDYFFLHQMDRLPICEEANIQISRTISLEQLTKETSTEILYEIAKQISLAYNHTSGPRCFNPDSKVFPWKQYTDYKN